jgi:hypothetical protein
MPVYHRLADIPSKRHKIYRKPSGELYSEELMGELATQVSPCDRIVYRSLTIVHCPRVASAARSPSF